jgi:hypothetical protein
MLDRALRPCRSGAFWPVWADAAYGGVSGAVQDSHIELRSGAGSGCPLT